ncbi:type I pullulanase [Ferruginibacter sp. SUN106]|uniref:type I pullulanase n=1 Tax=Ferruginibacter sp. SUN106 TaxID=2978348 RepID=UPI003D369EC7
MKLKFLLLYLMVTIMHSKAQINNFPIYTGKDLGLTYTPNRSTFKIWAPTATNAQLKVYSQPLGGAPTQTIDLKKATQGTWVATLSGNYVGSYYTFCVQQDGKWLAEVPDPYAKAVGTNGKRAMVVDLNQTNPTGWAKDKGPQLQHATAAIIYELHIRDASIAASSGITHKGKYAGLTETGTKNPAGQSTGLDHLKELGVTHIHLLPFFDYNSVDESDTGKPQYNWGYDPLNYNTPEGSYASNAADGAVRIKELKQLVQAFHKKGLALVMDVVYNHTGTTEQSNFNQLVPGYYYRHNKNGKLSDATACGNETASEQPMMRKFMIESVLYWAREYHIDGFRFDLMGVHDIETMNQISAALHKLNPNILIYGEGWTAGASPLPDSLRALKQNAAQLKGIAVFSDDIRDGIKGSVFEAADRGFASGDTNKAESVRFGIVAATQHPQIKYNKVNYSKKPYAATPANTISYAECHDNNTLWDKLAISAPKATVAQRTQMHKLALSMVLTSQGISFLHAGTEFLRSKKGIENSFNAGDSINAIDWNLKTTNKEVYNYVQGLIAMRKAHPAFRMATTLEIQQNLRFLEAPLGVIGYEINGAAVGDKWKTIQVWFNGTGEVQLLPTALVQGFKSMVVNNRFMVGYGVKGMEIGGYGCVVLYKE